MSNPAGPRSYSSKGRRARPSSSEHRLSCYDVDSRLSDQIPMFRRAVAPSEAARTNEVIAMRRRRFFPPVALSAVLLVAAAVAPPAAAGDWSGWRGPEQMGVSEETGLVAGWSVAGENLLWRADFVGRSTPVVFDGRVCANGRTGEGVTRQAVVACWDAGDGHLLWQRKINIYLTTVPFNRVGWGHPVADPETGYLFVPTVDGKLIAFDRDGETAWRWDLGEDVGRFSGYGGRTHSPIVDGDQVIMSVINSSWGDQGAPRHRYFSFDKRTGDILWVSTPGGGPADLNTFSTPVVAEIGGQRLLIGGNADGWVYALKATTGEKVWGFELSKRGLNTSVVVAGDTVFATHSEENVDEGTMGRVVAIDGTGSGEITKTHERWRAPVLAGYASPAVHDGVLYVVDNGANLVALDATSGKQLWVQDFGTVGKGSPVWAAGRIYVTEVNGNFVILGVDREKATVLDEEHLEMPGGRYAETYGSPAIAYGRVYFTSENGIFCLGDKDAPFDPKPAPAPKAPAAAPADAAPAWLQVVPAEVVMKSSGEQSFRARLYDAQGRFLRETEAQWVLAGLAGAVSGNGTFVPSPEAESQAGKLTAKVGDLTAAARIRVAAPLPLEENFDSLEPGGKRSYWIGSGKFKVVDREGQRVLMKPPSDRGIHRHELVLGTSDQTGYTIQADVLGTQEGRRRPDVGLIDSGYTLDLQGNHQRLELRSWDAALRIEEKVPYEWQPDTWYTLKLRVDQLEDKALVRGKVWKAGEPEPEAWTISAEDPLPVRSSSPALYGYSPVNLYFDNVKVMVNE